MKIRLPDGGYFLIDEEDCPLINKYSWHRMSGDYVITEVGNRRLKTRKVILLHKMIMNTPKEFDTDHINRNPLDNRKSNLRIVNRTQNNFNSGIHKNNKSGVKGVNWFKPIKAWRAYIGGGKNRIELGYFKDIQEAIKARSQAEELYIIK
jgi:hypothetical protein